ncbi:protein of unknown function [Acetoanaerobium sticklandii]|uniref:Uncharacterized protein n=1 Tax=Acetoanaerobium sticklandii (strain ATCC 12662 / DSM 519 / JCM 1433 / CCUG 9281 / NCIMB 10654 / HF) TaxID=499177 RepID=E3PY56_ACESD|nr:hypothetical protein [Acetoanaerobium sticklandii]CBH21371.1 protein of unknown function [Acetoanaerobium sticklandii]
MIKILNKITKNQTIEANSLFFYSIDKEEVKKKDFKRLDDAIKFFETAGVDARGKLIITFSGYMDNPLEIYQIDEIRDYVKELYQKHSNLFYFLSDYITTNQYIWLCLCNIQETRTLSNSSIKASEINIGENFFLINSVYDSFVNYADSIFDYSYESSLLLSSIGFLDVDKVVFFRKAQRVTRL